MMPTMPTQTRAPITQDQIAQYHQDGFLVIQDLIPPDLVAQLVERFEPMFAGEFETGVYPEEWHWNPYLGKPGAAGQMTGVWRCDRTLASVLMSAKIAQMAAALEGWSGARFLADGMWIKPPGAPPVSFHRNSPYVASLNPSNIVTCWIALSHATPAAGTLQIVPGSHRWDCTDSVRFLHAPREDYRAPLWRAAEAAGVATPEILSVDLSAGSAICFHGHLWHGSDGNQTAEHTRRSLAISTIHPQTQFRPSSDQGFIFSRYRRIDTVEMEESYFPILWSQDGYRTPFLADYCDDALAI